VLPPIALKPTEHDLDPIAAFVAAFIRYPAVHCKAMSQEGNFMGFRKISDQG
jgi:hypothetical protein